MSDAADDLGRTIDRLDSIACGLAIPITAQMHLTHLKAIIPEIVRELRTSFVALTGEDPWVTHPDRTTRGTGGDKREEAGS